MFIATLLACLVVLLPPPNGIMPALRQHNGSPMQILCQHNLHRPSMALRHRSRACQTSLVPRPSPSSVRNARAQFNAGVEKRKAWTNFTRVRDRDSSDVNVRFLI